LYARRRRVIAGKERGVEIESAYDPRRCQPHHGMVMTRPAPAPALPTVHVLAVIVILLRIERRRGVGQHPRDGGEEVVRCEQGLGAKPGGGEIDGVAGEGRNLFGRRRHRSSSWIGGCKRLSRNRSAPIEGGELAGESAIGPGRQQ